MKFIAKFWRANPQLKNGGYETTRKIEAETISAAKKLAYEIEKKAAYGSMSLRSIEEAEAPVEATTQEATEEAAPTAKKLYSAMVKDGKRVVIIRDQDYPNKAAFIRDLRANGYRVNHKKVKPSDVFDYICDHTDMNPWDWDLKKVPEESIAAQEDEVEETTKEADTMTRRIKFAHITMQGGLEAVLSTVELEPGLYETMLASPDFDTEYAQLRSTNEGTAISDFNFLRKKFHVSTLTGKYADLAKDLEAAAAYGLEVAANVEDGGTCNMDAVTLDLRGWRRDKVEQAAKAAGVGCFVWSLYGHKRYVFTVRSGGQANRRTAAAEAMREALKLSGYDAGMYYQMD